MHVWVSLTYLPVYFIHCKYVLFSITAAIGTPLHVDHATVSVNRPSVARVVLIEYDVSRPLLPHIWIGEGDTGFWQDVVFEQVRAYCGFCKHLDHSVDTHYVANPGLRKANKPVGESKGVVPRDKGKVPVLDVVVQTRVPRVPQYVVIDDKRP